MARPKPFRHPEPMSAINVTPFIDVLLVLLIMLILTVPIATHKLPIDLPRGSSASVPEEPHKLSIDRRGALYWDGRGIADAELPELLASIVDDPQAVLHLQTDEATRYERFDSVLARVKRAGVTRLGFIGNEQMKL